MAQFKENTLDYKDANNESKQLFYLTAGPKEGPLMIWMHGWPAIAKTWQEQLVVFAGLGFSVVAPDMPGYGNSTSRKKIEDYSQENVITAMLALLKETGRDQAIWIGHDWGCGPLWTLANTRPDVCIAVIGMCVPYHTIELGFKQVLPYINRDIYPEDQYPYGQWDYQVYYEQSFDKTWSWIESDTAGFMKVLYGNGNPAGSGKPARTSSVTKNGGWFGGGAKPPSAEQIPDEILCIDQNLYKELVAAMEKTGFYGASAWYMNHKANREYNFKHTKDDSKLDMPVLFFEAKYDFVCDTVTSPLAQKMRELCSQLTEVSVEAGHWVPQEKALEVNAAIARWLVESVSESWPGQPLLKK